MSSSETFWNDSPDRTTPLSKTRLGQWAALIKGEARAAVATDAADPGTALGAHLDGTYAPMSRRFVVFGDSWTTTLDGVNIPAVAIASIGGTLVANHGVAGAIIGPTSQNSGNATDAQVTAAQADTTYDKDLITDVLVIAGVNNIGGYLPTVTEAAAFFSAMGNLYPHARLWYVANSKKAINNAGDSDPWRWYARLFEGAALAGFETAPFSPMWNWGTNRATYWAGDSTDSSRHMAAAGQTAWAKRLAGFLSGGDGWRPHFKVATALHPNATALVGTAAISTDDTHIDGNVLRVRVSIGGMDSLSSVSTSAFQAVLTIPTAYTPIGNYNRWAGVGARLSGGTMDTYWLDVAAGVISVDARALNAHVGYFIINADVPLTTIKTA